MKRLPETWRPRVGDLVEIEFLDHASTSGYHDGTPLSFTVWGRLAGINKAQYTVNVWDYTHKDQADNPGNIESFNIVKGGILFIRKLRRGK